MGSHTNQQWCALSPVGAAQEKEPRPGERFLSRVGGADLSWLTSSWIIGRSIMCKIWILGILLAVALSGMAGAGTIEATTSDGKKVILRPDGTWSYVQPTKAGAEANRFEKPAAATEVLKSQKGFCEVWYDRGKWQQIPPSNPAAEFELIHASREANALIITERIAMPMSALRNAALANARKAAPDIAIEWEQERTVNGARVLAMRLAGTTQGVPFKYYCHYWAGKAGVLQVITFTGANLFNEFQADFTDLLNGLVITKE
jgi:hypothetical protein